MKERLTYLDAAKGIGMILIVCAHTGASCPIPMIGNAKVALFFLLSGLFFSPKAVLPFKEYLKGDTMRILVPFVFFYLVSYAIFYAGYALVPGFTELTGAKGILDCFTQKQYFNGPLWFLLSLFWMRLLCYFIERYVSIEWLRIVAVLIVGLVGFLLGKYEFDLPLNFDTAMTYTPVFYAGIIATKREIFKRYTKVEYGVFSIVLYISCLSVSMPIHESFNRYGGGILI